MSGRLIGPKTFRTELLEYFEPVLDSVGNVWMVCVIIYAINYGFSVLGLKMVMDFGSTLLGEWAAHGQPIARVATVKNSPGLLGWTENGSCVL